MSRLSSIVKRLLLLALGAACFPAIADAAPRTSASYSIATETEDAAGRRVASASYTLDTSTGGIGALAAAASPALTAKGGYAGQFFDVTGLTLTAASATVNETATDQLGAWLALDDATFLAVIASNVAWSVQSGPLTGISPAGLATAGVVYQDTSATAQGVHLGFTTMLGLTVINALPDNFGSYTGDGLGDDWQVQYFGQDNPLAAPAQDPDGDAQTNHFEFITGLVPTDVGSRFSVRPQLVPGQPGQRAIVFGPVVAGRTYTVIAWTTFTNPAWDPLESVTTEDNGTERTVTDLAAGSSEKLYRVEIARP